jgi:hypothetical protein
MDISNKFLAFLLVIAIIVTLVGAWYSVDKINSLALITGYGTEGYLNVTITNYSAINLTATDCDFGSGYVLSNASSAKLASNGTVEDWNGAGTGTSMRIQNDGNKNVSVNVSSGKTAATFFGGGTSPSVKVWSFNNTGIDETGCWSGWVDYTGTEMDTSQITICTNLVTGSGVSGDDIMYAGCYLSVPNDAPTGAKTDVWTFTGTTL